MATLQFETIAGPGGTGHYIADYRCGGSKPMGGGKVTHTARLNPVDVVTALAGTVKGKAALDAHAAKRTPAEVIAELASTPQGKEALDAHFNATVRDARHRQAGEAAALKARAAIRPMPPKPAKPAKP